MYLNIYVILITIYNIIKYKLDALKHLKLTYVRVKKLRKTIY